MATRHYTEDGVEITPRPRTLTSQLFWTQHVSPDISVMAGTLDGLTGLVMDRQICIESKGDYYALPNVANVDQSTL